LQKEISARDRQASRVALIKHTDKENRSMVKKKIRKFFNSVSMRETMMILVEEEKENHISLIWIASASFFILIVSLFAFLVIKEELPIG
jgi:hypothetical protein